MSKDLGRCPSGRATHEQSHSSVSLPSVSVPKAEVEAVLHDIGIRFGPGISNGVYAILLHRELPKTFGKADWARWQFKPADAAFEWAHDRGLIGPWKLSSKWRFTALGDAVAAYVQANAEAIEARVGVA